MTKNRLLAFILLLASQCACAQLFGNDKKLDSLKEFDGGEFQFQSVKNIYWQQIASQPRASILNQRKTWVPARLYMPSSTAGKVPAMVIIHGIGGLYMRDGRKRAYWDYAELLAKNGIAAVIVDSHGARDVGVTKVLGSTNVSVYTFVADAFAAADMLRSHTYIDPDRIGIMGFSKGGMTALLALDQRFTAALSSSGRPFALHLPIYPGCQNFPEKLRSTGAPVHMLLGERDNYTGTSGCSEIEAKLKAAGTPVTVITYPGALHSWDEDFSPIQINDVSSADCRWVLRDDGEVWGDGVHRLNTAADGQAYFRGCTKEAEIYIGRTEPANTLSRKAVVDIAKSTFSVTPQK